ncbi:tyrosine-type recombinase/integrase [Candidatus Bathyarchaeota archaeon]|nr:tyrosine-type recombinase/integrase [Candidatus Bathyarchaeota archaeon]
MSKTKEFLNTQHSLGKKTRDSYLNAIIKFEKLAKKPFEKVYLDKKIVHKVLNLICQEISVSSWNLYLAKYKRIAKWLSDPEDEVTPNLWRKIKSKKIDWEEKLKDKWLSKEQFYKLLDVVDYPRDKAMYGVCVDGALRSGELLELRIKDVLKTSYGYDVVVSGKTGTSSFPVVLFAPLLTQWLNFHPCKHEKNAPLWPRRTAGRTGFVKEPLGRDGAYISLNKYAKRAELPHISLRWLRHTKITWTAKDKNVRVSDEMAKKMFRWNKNSTMYSHYTHLHGVDSKDIFLALTGVKEVEEGETDSVLDNKKCLNCGELNSATMMFCGKCGTTLDEEEAKRQVAKQRLLEEMLNDFQERMQYQENLKTLNKKGIDKKVLEEQEKRVNAMNRLIDVKTKLDVELFELESKENSSQKKN